MKMKQILLIQPPFQPDHFYKDDYFSVGKQTPLFPFGVAYIAAYLEQFGYNVAIFDIYAKQLSKAEVLTELTSMEYDVVGISALVTQYEYVKWLSQEIKKIKPVPIVLGNGLGSACYKVVLDNIPEIDVCIRGEGEITTKETVENLENLAEVSGVVFRGQDGEMCITPNRAPIKDVDTLPLPAYELFNVEPYLKARIYDTGILDIRSKLFGKKVLPVLTSRGCPYNCNFCGKVIKVARLRGVDSVISEIKYLKETYGIDGVHFIDELFAVSKKRAMELSKALKPLNLFWDCQARVNTIDYETLRAMKDAGCVALGLGIESGSQAILDNMNKKATVEQAETALKSAKQLGLPVKVQLIFGYPGESYTTLRETQALFKRVGLPSRPMSAIVPIPDTVLWEYARQKGMVDDTEDCLIKVTRGFDENICLYNFTDFHDYFLEDIRKRYDKVMLDNYGNYLVSHPIEAMKALLRFKTLRVLFVVSLLKRLRLYYCVHYIWRTLYSKPPPDREIKV